MTKYIMHNYFEKVIIASIFIIWCFSHIYAFYNIEFSYTTVVYGLSYIFWLISIKKKAFCFDLVIFLLWTIFILFEIAIVFYKKYALYTIYCNLVYISSNEYNGKLLPAREVSWNYFLSFYDILYYSILVSITICILFWLLYNFHFVSFMRSFKNIRYNIINLKTSPSYNVTFVPAIICAVTLLYYSDSEFVCCDKIFVLVFLYYFYSLFFNNNASFRLYTSLLLLFLLTTFFASLFDYERKQDIISDLYNLKSEDGYDPHSYERPYILKSTLFYKHKIFYGNLLSEKAKVVADSFKNENPEKKYMLFYAILIYTTYSSIIFGYFKRRANSYIDSA